jgi:hypothetical protein
MVYPLATASITSASNCGPIGGVSYDRCLSCLISGLAGASNVSASLRVSNNSGSLSGTLVFFVGGDGNNYYEGAFSYSTGSILNASINNGYKVIQARWNNNPFSGTLGPLVLAGTRNATLLKAIYDDPTLYTAGTVFGALGNSGGSSQIAYSLAHFGAGDWLDLAVMTSGPPHGRIDYGVAGTRKPSWVTLGNPLRTVANGAIGYSDSATSGQFLDLSYGDSSSIRRHALGLAEGGPTNTPFKDSVFNGTAQLTFPKTSIYFIYGDNDNTEAVPLGRVFANAISGATILVTSGSVGHNLPNFSSGASLIMSAITSSYFRH